MERIVNRMLPYGFIGRVQPFHISLEGTKKAVLCRDDDDYSTLVKIIAVCAKRKNTILVIYVVVSNHCHAIVLAESQKQAKDCGEEIKRMWSMWLHNKYHTSGILEGMDTKAICLDSNWYLRNALAYVPRNALDNGCNVEEYRWSGYRGMFSTHIGKGWRKVSGLTRREKERVMHTREDLSDVCWMISENDELEPVTICDHHYLEQAFEMDQSYFLRLIGSLNPAEMQLKLVDNPRKMSPDTEFLKTVNDISLRWYKQPLSDLPLEKKIRMIPYINRITKTSVAQLSRVFGISRDDMHSILRLK